MKWTKWILPGCLLVLLAVSVAFNIRYCGRYFGKDRIAPKLMETFLYDLEMGTPLEEVMKLYPDTELDRQPYGYSAYYEFGNGLEAYVLFGGTEKGYVVRETDIYINGKGDRAPHIVYDPSLAKFD